MIQGSLRQMVAFSFEGCIGYQVIEAVDGSKMAWKSKGQVVDLVSN